MTTEFLIGIRNDFEQILVLQDRKGDPVLPSGVIDESDLARERSAVVNPFDAVRRAVIASLGPDTQGYHLIDTPKFGTITVFLYTAYLRAGRLCSFPTDRYLSSSWIAAGLVPRVCTTPAARKLMEGLAWLTQGPPR